MRGITLIYLLVAVLKMRKNVTRDAVREDRRLHTYTHARTLADKKKEQRGARRTGKINSVPWRVVHKRERKAARRTKRGEIERRVDE